MGTLLLCGSIMIKADSVSDTLDYIAYDESTGIIIVSERPVEYKK